MKIDLDYVDPRFVALYDASNPRGMDYDFYLQLAADLEARAILDLGCGTGLLTRELATEGRRVTGVDPAPAMLDYAKRQPGAERVRWVEGDSGVLGAPGADLAIMTGNVAQVFLDDAVWAAGLRDLHAALRPGGRLAFESRNPDARAWEGWNRAATYERNDVLECWMDVVSVEEGRVHLVGHNIFAGTDEDVVVNSTLRFRSRAELEETLQDAGFTVEHVYGDWQRGPVTPASRVMVFVVRRG